jgi:L-fuculokinase
MYNARPNGARTMKPQTVLVLDIGKTNKKAAVYDRGFRVVAEERIALDTAKWNGLEVEQTDAILAWFRDQLRGFARDFDIRAISISGHGATLALLDERGDLALPVLSYTSPVDAAFHEEFYREYGSRAALHRATASPDLGFVNMAKMLHYVKTRLPERWAACRRGLFYPQFFAHALTGGYALEPTYVGNHSYLWDYARKDWSEVARRLGADKLFGGPMRAPWDVLGPLRDDWMRDCGIGAQCRVLIGIHDSNANLLPYLARGESQFLLNSTGTWCVLMQPSTSSVLSEDQAAAGLFFNQSAYGGPVLTGLLPAGMEYEAFAKLAPFADAQDETSLARVIADRDLFLIPGTLPDVPVFPGARPGLVVGNRRFSLDELMSGAASGVIGTLRQRYFAALNLALALATKRALAHVDAPRKTRAYIEGGFASNFLYCRLVATLCPRFDWSLTPAKEGTAFGAALCGWSAADDTDPRELSTRYSISTRAVASIEGIPLAQYEAEFLKRAGAKDVV